MRLLSLIFLLLMGHSLSAQNNDTYILIPDRVFDGIQMHSNWKVVISQGMIAYAGNKIPDNYANTRRIELPERTLMPGLIEGHAHVLLHPYNETPWNDQVLKEAPALRAIRAVDHLKSSLEHGITTLRDLGSEGAGYTDVAVREALEQGLISGPEIIVAGPAIVATGSYGPKGFHDGVTVPLGAQEADGIDGVRRTVREQLGNGVDFIKVYADYRWGPEGSSRPTFSEEELRTMVETAKSGGSYVVAHAGTEEGMRRAIMAGVETIEHGDAGTAEIFKLMQEKNIGYCPTLAAVEAISAYNNYNKGVDPEPARIIQKKKSFKAALESGVQIVFGGDVGVFSHGENAWELELMVEYGMKPLEALRSATSGNAQKFHYSDRGMIAEGMRADLIVVDGNPGEEISVTRNPLLVVQNGVIVVDKRN
ncbi:metal-dependent hydrolase family protein [Fulvivirga sedimenti]|uniref:Amidohydrolase family protein n=1 Tax=Fulvivirga sedimenti TaxID=2879465 RepID=A0A9X1HUQ7_9BACT|nr:amidohydrolase family protein [Fulvivirga sedimenti]MCA6078669.1 amidohydrolase family protein [Fulvivirga sedimenti]